MTRLLLSFLLLAGMAQIVGAATPDVRYHAETGMYRCDLSNPSLTNGQELVLELTYPFATVTNLYLELDGQVQATLASGAAETAAVVTTLKAPGGWLSGTAGLSRPRVKLRAQGTVRLKSVTADCGRSQRMLQQRELPPLQQVPDEIGSVRCHSSNSVVLHPREAYYAIATPHLSAAQMHSYSDLVNTPNRFEATFFVSNPNQHAVTGRLEITLPSWAETATARVSFFSRTTGMISGIPQPADRIQFNDQAPIIPGADGWLPWGDGMYQKVATNDTMTLTWNQFRRHAKETRALSLNNPVSFKGRALYEYLHQDGSWAVLPHSPWVSCPIPANANPTPFKLRVTCLGDTDRGNFSGNGNLVIPSTLLVENDYFLPIDDGDGRGNPLSGWKVNGIKTEGTQNILGIAFQLDANANPLLLEPRGSSRLINPGPQVLVRVEVNR